MSDAPKEGAKKKGGKLPILIALIVVVASGGYFFLKGKGSKETKEPEVKLGSIEPLPEFIVNLADGRSFLKTEIAIHFADGFKKEEFEHNLPAVRDAVLGVLTAAAPDSIRTANGKEELKAKIAEAVNHTVEAPEDKASKSETPKSEKAQQIAKELEKEKLAEMMANAKSKGWDSPKGPALKVYFTTFVIQQF